jgi:hypothetical protein
VGSTWTVLPTRLGNACQLHGWSNVVGWQAVLEAVLEFVLWEHASRASLHSLLSSSLTCSTPDALLSVRAPSVGCNCTCVRRVSERPSHIGGASSTLDEACDAVDEAASRSRQQRDGRACSTRRARPSL